MKTCRTVIAVIAASAAAALAAAPANPRPISPATRAARAAYVRRAVPTNGLPAAEMETARIRAAARLASRIGTNRTESVSFDYSSGNAVLRFVDGSMKTVPVK